VDKGSQRTHQSKERVGRSMAVRLPKKWFEKMIDEAEGPVEVGLPPEPIKEKNYNITVYFGHGLTHSFISTESQHKDLCDKVHNKFAGLWFTNGTCGQVRFPYTSVIMIQAQEIKND
jgi:hypothetical protein